MTEVLTATWAIARRDLLAAFTTPLAWLIVAAWCLIVGTLSVIVVEDARNIPLGSPPVAVILDAIWCCLLAPALSMTSFSNERQHGTMILLACWGAGDYLGKFLISGCNSMP